MSDGTTLVTPALVRDYRRLLRLFPYTYRRAHEAEMLGHLLDAAAPGQTRPSRADRTDLLRAAAREWLLAPLGSTPQQRSAATRWLLVLLPLVLALPAARSLGGAAWAIGAVGSGEVDLPGLVAVDPLGPSWLVWTVGMLALALGWRHAARTILAVGAALAWAVMAGLLAVSSLDGGIFGVYTGMGWVVGQTALAVVVATGAGTPVAASSRRWAIPLVAGAGVVPAVVTVTQGLLGVRPWLSEGAGGFWYDVGTGTVLVTGGLLTAGMLASRSGRQALPVLAGVVVAVGLGRVGLLASSLQQLDVVDLGNVLGLLAFSLAATLAARWVVNRVDELAAARAHLSRPAEHAVVHGIDVDSVHNCMFGGTGTGTGRGQAR